MSLDMFPDSAIAYLIEHSSYNEWMEYAVAHHSNKEHDDFYNLFGEGLYDLHATYYPNCTDALEYYIPEGERVDWETIWAISPRKDFPIEIVGQVHENIVELIELNPDVVFFYGPRNLFDTYSVTSEWLIRICKMAVNGCDPGRSPGFPMAAREQPGTGVETLVSE